MTDLTHAAVANPQGDPGGFCRAPGRMFGEGGSRPIGSGRGATPLTPRTMGVSSRYDEHHHHGCRAHVGRMDPGQPGPPGRYDPGPCRPPRPVHPGTEASHVARVDDRDRMVRPMIPSQGVDTPADPCQDRLMTSTAIHEDRTHYANGCAEATPIYSLNCWTKRGYTRRLYAVVGLDLFHANGTNGPLATITLERVVRDRRSGSYVFRSRRSYFTTRAGELADARYVTTVGGGR